MGAWPQESEQHRNSPWVTPEEPELYDLSHTQAKSPILHTRRGPLGNPN